jgi:hypothetical protein
MEALRKQQKEDGVPAAFEVCEQFEYLPMDLRASLRRGSKSAAMAREIYTIFRLPL